MISRITGTIIEKIPLHIVVDCNGLGYSLSVPMSTFEKLPKEGERIHLFTYHISREDSQMLFGFSSGEERNVFSELVKINSVGPKLALAILSTFSLSDLHQIVEENDALRLTNVPKVGKKTAERLLIDLKDRLNKKHSNKTFIVGLSKNIKENERNDVISALLALGYSAKEAQKAFDNIEPTPDLSKNIRLALQQLS